MIHQKIAEEIAKIRKENEIAVISICGAADTGKSTLAKLICAELEILDISCDSISTDSFLIDRAERINQHISGYNPKALKKEDLLTTLNTIQQKIPYEYFPYNSITGKNLSEGKIIQNIDVLIVEGIHALNENILDNITLKVFIDSNEVTLRKLRFNANINKRRFLEKEAGQRIDNEMKDYYEFVAPNKKYADIIFQIDENYNYQ